MQKTMDVPFELPLLFDVSDPTVGRIEPTGLLLPPLGESSFEDVYAVCRKAIRSPAETEKRLLLLNRQTSLADARAALLAARGSTQPVFACFPAELPESEERFLPALITLQAMGAKAVGLYGVSGKSMLAAVRAALPHAAVPLITVADAEPGQTPDEFCAAVRPLLDAGVRILGCGANTAPEHLGALREIIKKYGSPEISEEPDCYAAATEWETFFLGDNIEFSETIRCSSSLGDKLIDLDDEQVSAALVNVDSIDDAVLLGQSSSMAKLPVAVHADSPTVLEATLRYFQGRLIIDSGSPIDRKVLEPLAAKYGAIIY